MSHGLYDLNLGSEILILGGDIRSRKWSNIGDSYGTTSFLMENSILNLFGSVDVKITPDFCFKNNFVVPI